MSSPLASMDLDELARRLNYSVVLPGRLAGLGWPFRRDAAKADVARLLQRENVAVLVNLTGEAYPEAGRVLFQGIQTVDIEVEDYAPPRLDQVDELWRLFTSLPEGRVLAIHCAAGIGRTGTMLACLLGRQLKLSAGAVIEHLRTLRPDSVETEEQEVFIAEWLGRGPHGGMNRGILTP